MPGRGSYGPGGKWIHDRAEHIMASTRDQYGSEEKAKRIAYALATQQAHKLGKTPKRGAGPKGTYGTPEGKRAAKNKYDKSKGEYVKAPAPKTASAYIGLPLVMRLKKMAAGLTLPDPQTGLNPRPPVSSIGTKPKSYSKINVTTTPPNSGLTQAVASVPPPKV